MNYLLRLTPGAKRKMKKRCKKNSILRKRTEQTLEELSRNPFYPGLETHKVFTKTIHAPALASSINGEYRIVWELSTGNIIDILDFGTHKEVYL